MKQLFSLVMICTFLIIAFAVLASGVTLQDEITMRNIADEINQNSSLPAMLLTPHKSIKNKVALDYIPNYMSFDYFSDDYTLIFEGFPTDEDEFFLTEIILHGGTYHIIGIQISDEMEEAKNVLEEHGFLQLDSNTPLQYMKENVVIKLEGRDIVEAIAVELPSAYTSGNLY